MEQPRQRTFWSDIRVTGDEVFEALSDEGKRSALDAQFYLQCALGFARQEAGRWVRELGPQAVGRAKQKIRDFISQWREKPPSSGQFTASMIADLAGGPDGYLEGSCRVIALLWVLARGFEADPAHLDEAIDKGGTAPGKPDV